MSHRVHPKIFRIREMKDWDTRGFYEKNAPQCLEEDFKIRTFLKNKFKTAGVARIEIERFPSKINIIIATSRPGFIIGRGGEEIERLKKKVKTLLSSPAGRQVEKKDVKIEVQGIRDPWASAVLSAQWIAQRIEKRMAFRRVLKQSLSKIMASKNTGGAKVQVSGRLNGVEMARTEWLKQGQLPRQTIRKNIDYGTALAFCTYGVIGVKVWIYVKPPK